MGFAAEEYLSCKEWISERIEEGNTWEQVKSFCVSDSEAFSVFDKLQNEDLIIPLTMSFDDWGELVEEMRSGYTPLYVPVGLSNGKLNNSFSVPIDSSVIKEPVKVAIGGSTDVGKVFKIKEGQTKVKYKKNNNKPIALNEKQKESIINEVKDLTPLGYGISFEDFVVRSNKRYCAFNHDSVYIVARISVLTKGGKIVNKDIPAGYCPNCGCYYITQYDFDIIGEYGLPLCQQFTQEEYLQIKTGERRHIYKAHSILSQMGYNVGQKDNLSNTQRRDILSLAIDKGIYSKAQLDSFLNWLISSRKQNPSMENAIDRWQDDRLFIKDYKKGDCKIVGVKSITGKLKAKLK